MNPRRDGPYLAGTRVERRRIDGLGPVECRRRWTGPTPGGGRFSRRRVSPQTRPVHPNPVGGSAGFVAANGSKWQQTSLDERGLEWTVEPALTWDDGCIASQVGTSRARSSIGSRISAPTLKHSLGPRRYDQSWAAVRTSPNADAPTSPAWWRLSVTTARTLTAPTNTMTPSRSVSWCSPGPGHRARS